MNSKRIVFLMLAFIVAGATAFLARAWLQAERAAMAAQVGVRAPDKPAVQVLVARNNVRVGQIIKAEDLRWQPWPPGNLPPSYIVEGKRQLADFAGAVARSALHVGEPVVESEIVMPGSRGFLAAVLKPGMRAVSVPANATTAVSGFIHAGDRVDVLLTHTLTTEGGGGQHNATETILRNARVIAMDQKLDYAVGDKADIAKTATLELTAKQVEIITLGVKMGDLSLALRSLQDPDEEERDAASDEDATAELGNSFTHDTQVSRLIKEPTPPASKQAEAAKTSVFVLRGGKSNKQDLDGSASADPAATPPTEPETATKPNAPRTTFTRTIPSVPQ